MRGEGKDSRGLHFSSFTHSLFRNPTDSTSVQLFRYTFVGGLAFVVDFALLFSFTEFLGLHYLLSAAAGFLGGLLTNYLLSVSWVFSRRNMKNRIAEFGIFAFIGLVGLALNEMLIWFFTEKAGIYYLVSKVITGFIVYLWNFFARKYSLFK